MLLFACLQLLVVGGIVLFGFDDLMLVCLFGRLLVCAFVWCMFTMLVNSVGSHFLRLLVWFGLRHVGLLVGLLFVGLCLVLFACLGYLFCVFHFANIVALSAKICWLWWAWCVAVLDWCFM